MANCIGNLAAQDARVGQAVRSNLPAGTPHPPDQTLNPEKIAFRVGSSRRGEKRSVAASEIDFERRRVAIDSLEIERSEIIRRNNFRCDCLGNELSGVEHRLLE